MLILLAITQPHFTQASFQTHPGFLIERRDIRLVDGVFKPFENFEKTILTMETTLKTIIVGVRHLKLRDLLTDRIASNLPLVV